MKRSCSNSSGQAPQHCLEPSRGSILLRAAISVAFANVCLGAAAGIAAASPPVYVDGVKTGVTAIVRHGRAFVPVRGVFERLHANVAYTPPRTVVARKGNRDIARLALHSKTAQIDGRTRTLDTAPFVSRSRVYVPLRLISEAAGATVLYRSAPASIKIDGARVAALAAPAVAAPIVAASAAPAAASPQQSIPGWVWLLAALLALAAIVLFFLMRRRKADPIITTRSSTGDPTIKTRR